MNISIRVLPLIIISYLILILSYMSVQSHSQSQSRNWGESSEIIERLKHKRLRRSSGPDDNKLIRVPWNYSMFHPPPLTEIDVSGNKSISKPTDVKTTVVIMGVRGVDEMHERISVDLKLIVEWQDIRIKNEFGKTPGHFNDYDVLHLDNLDVIWHPDVHIDQLKYIESPVILSKPMYLKFFREGFIELTIRMSVTLVCQMDFRFYPADTQNCPINIRSYAYSSDLLTFTWYDVRLLDNITLSNYDLERGPLYNYFPSPSETQYGFQGIGFTLILRRDLSYHLIQTYLPSVLFILVSWLSFILPLDSASDRMSFCMTCLFTLTAMFSAVRQSTPNVSYVKALDIWMIVCIFFVFLTLVQHALMSRVQKRKLRKQSTKKLKMNESRNCENGNRHRSATSASTLTSASTPNTRILQSTESIELKLRASPQTPETENAQSKSKQEQKQPESISKEHNNMQNNTRRQSLLTVYHSVAKKANKYLTLIIPILFLIFNVVYWTALFVLASRVNHVENKIEE